jgi:anti-sigma B factor antagonist
MTVHIRFERVSGWARTPARLPDHERSPVLNVDLSIRDLDGQAVVALRGELGLADAPSVASHLIAAVAACGPWVIVDLADLEGIDYSGLSVLLRVRKWTRRSGGDLSLAAPQQPVRRILEISGLIDVFSVYSSVEEAASRTRPAAVTGGAAAHCPPFADGDLVRIRGWLQLSAAPPAGRG